jgi:hypothetical protein
MLFADVNGGLIDLMRDCLMRAVGPLKRRKFIMSWTTPIRVESASDSRSTAIFRPSSDFQGKAMWRILMVALVALACRLTISPADAQAIPKSLQEGGPEAAIKLRKNNWTVGIVGGLIDGTYMRFADELGKALDDGENLRILPIVSYGAIETLEIDGTRHRISPVLRGLRQGTSFMAGLA